MKAKTHLGYAIEAIDELKARYDKNVKEILSDVQVLARIVKHTVSEVEKLSIEQIMECIDPQSIRVGTVPVVPGLTNLDLHGFQGEWGFHQSDFLKSRYPVWNAV